MNKKGNVIAHVVERDRCSGCGVCAGVCPGQNLVMSLAMNGDLTPHWANGHCGKDCAMCINVCPFADGFFDPRPINIETFGPKNGNHKSIIHEHTGYYDTAFVGYSETNRLTSASGGLLTWTLVSLLETEKVDSIAVVALENEKKRGFKFVFKEAKTIEELRQCSGSVYHQVEISDIIRRMVNKPNQRWAITGVPCLCTGLRKAMKLFPKLDHSVCYVFGLACGMYQNTFYTELLLAKSGVDRDFVKQIEYRRKSAADHASDYRFRGTDNQRTGEEVPYHDLPYYLGRNAFFRANACNYCMDVFSESGDACFMDAWLPEYNIDPSGTNLVLIRNPIIRQMMEKGMINKSILINGIAIEKVIASQMGHVNRKRRLIAMRQGEKVDRLTGRKFTLEERLEWRVQRYVQRRSKEAWNSVGRGKGLKYFWLSLYDVIALIRFQQLFQKTFGRALRLAFHRKGGNLSI